MLKRYVSVGHSPSVFLAFTFNVPSYRHKYGLIGSTEWCEDFGDWLQKHGGWRPCVTTSNTWFDMSQHHLPAVSYLNLDVSVAGTNFHGSASPSLALLLKSAAEQIEHPTDATRSLWSMKDGGDWKEFNVLQDEVDFEELFASGTGIGALGSGSDYTAFLQRYGVASTDMGYGGGPRDPPYHYHRYVVS
jgi:N-acetylated-alpha-linked acidic dipeptidase